MPKINNVSGKMTIMKRLGMNKLIKSYMCSLSKMILLEPVLAQDGYTYERQMIEKWLIDNTKSPVTGEYMNNDLIEVHPIKSRISDLLEKYPMYKNKQYVINNDYMSNKKKIIKYISQNNYMELQKYTNFYLFDKVNGSDFYRSVIRASNEIQIYILDNSIDIDKVKLNENEDIFTVCSSYIFKYFMNKFELETHQFVINFTSNEYDGEIVVLCLKKMSKDIKYLQNNKYTNVLDIFVQKIYKCGNLNIVKQFHELIRDNLNNQQYYYYLGMCLDGPQKHILNVAFEFQTCNVIDYVIENIIKLNRKQNIADVKIDLWRHGIYEDSNSQIIYIIKNDKIHYEKKKEYISYFIEINK